MMHRNQVVEAIMHHRVPLKKGYQYRVGESPLYLLNIEVRRCWGPFSKRVAGFMVDTGWTDVDTMMVMARNAFEEYLA